MSVQSTKLRLFLLHASGRVKDERVRSENWCARTKRVEHTATKIKACKASCNPTFAEPKRQIAGSMAEAREVR